MTEPVWKRSATFSHLAQGQTGTHSVSNLVAALANELPISTESAFAEVEDLTKLLRKEFFKVSKGSHIMDNTGKKKVVTSEMMSEDHPGNLIYFEFLCQVEPTATDIGITQGPIMLYTVVWYK